MGDEKGHRGSGRRGEQRIDASVIRAAAARFDGTLDHTLRSAVVPYGYTVTIWASGAYLISERGLPNLVEVFAFVSGAMLAFALLSAFAQGRESAAGAGQRSRLHPESAHPLLAAGLHIAAVGLALGVASLIDTQLGDFAWFAGSLAVTLIYLSIASAELALAFELRERELGLRAASRVITHGPRRVIRRAGRR